MNNNTEYIVNALEKADKLTYSYQCPYLALADILGYITPFEVKHMPSKFSRLSTRKMLLTSGLPKKHARRIYRMLENGYTLSEIADRIKSRNAMRIKI